MSALKRKYLVETEVNQEDRRRKYYRAKGNFDQADWSDYLAEHQDSIRRFKALLSIASLPENQIQDAISDYFGDE